MDDPVWISEKLAIAVHKRQLAEHGGLDGVRDLGLLQSALARPRYLFACTDPTPSLPTMAGAYGFGIARNHPFIDGNKRTAAVVCELVLNLNEWTVSATDLELFPVFLGLAAGEVSETELITCLVAHCSRV